MGGEGVIWSVGGGKGGVGKSVATANLGCALAERGARVLLVDADLGGSNLHTYFGIKYPERGLEDFMKGRAASLEEVALPSGVDGLSIICGGGEFLGIANPAHARKQKLINHIRRLDADYILVDLGAGSSYNVLDFFAVSARGIIVLVPEPAAVQNAYIFLKSFVYRRLSRLFRQDPLITALIEEATDPRAERGVRTFADLCERIAKEDPKAAEAAVREVRSFRPGLLLNMASSGADLKVVEAFTSAASTFLGTETDYLGMILSRPEIKAAARKMRPYMLDAGAGEAREELMRVVERIVSAGAGQRDEGAPESAGSGSGGPAPGGGTERGAEAEVFGFNDNVSVDGTVVHVQTEVTGGRSPEVQTVIYHGGRIYFSKKTPRSDISGDLRGFADRQHRAAMAAVRMGRIPLGGLGDRQ